MNNVSDKSGKIEAFFVRIDEALWRDSYARYHESKVRADYAFAEALDLESHPAAKRELQDIWQAVISRFVA